MGSQTIVIGDGVPISASVRRHTRAGNTRTSLRLAAVGLTMAACVGGCARLKSVVDTTLARPAPSAPIARQQDPLAEFVGSAPVGQTVTYTGGADHFDVRVVAAYAAASGQECRSFVVADRTPQRVVCMVDGGWTEIRPLVQDNPNASAATVP